MPISYAEALQAQLAEYKASRVACHGRRLLGKEQSPIPAHSPSNLVRPEPVRAATVGDARPHQGAAKLDQAQGLSPPELIAGDVLDVLMPALVMVGGLQQLGAALGTSSPIKAMEFEAIPDQVEFTNFDCVLDLENGGTVYLEAKLTEREFGGAAKNEQRELKRTGLYTPRLLAKVPPELLVEAAFFARYQLLRNLSHLKSAADRLVLLLPRASAGLVRQAEAFRELVLPPWQAQVSVVFLEDLIERLAAQTDARARLHFEECKRKYVLRKREVASAG